MKTVCSCLAAVVLLAACSSPVLRKDVIEQGVRDVGPSRILANPDAYRGQLFILGGVIASTQLIPEGTMIEAAYVPVDKNGYLQETDRSAGRFLAFYPKEHGVLDPLMYREGKEITLAGVFNGTREGAIGQMPYVFPLFTIQDLYLWTEPRQASYYPNTFFSFGFLFGGR